MLGIGERSSDTNHQTSESSTPPQQEDRLKIVRVLKCTIVDNFEVKMLWGVQPGSNISARQTFGDDVADLLQVLTHHGLVVHSHQPVTNHDPATGFRR